MLSMSLWASLETFLFIDANCRLRYIKYPEQHLIDYVELAPTSVAHASLLPGGPESFIDAFAGRIISTHVSDNDLVLDRHVPVGNGKIDFKRVFGNLMKIGFKGTMNIELPRSNEDRVLSKGRLEPILDELGILKEALTP